MSEQEWSFGQRIKQQRRELDLTQEALAVRAGYSVDTIRRVEAGSLRPSRQLAEILAAKLEIPPAEQAALVALARSGRLRQAASAPGGSAAPQAAAVVGLPAQQTPLIGRRREITACLAVLRAADARLLTLVGPGGAGKTRLAFRITEELGGGFGDGAYVAQLASISNPDLVVPAIAEILGLTETAGVTLSHTLKAFLREKQILLTLDNFEQVAPAASLLGELLVEAPGLKLLVTSREVLRLSGEQVFLVPPLSLPDLKALPSLEMLPSYEGIALFVQRAAAARVGFALTADNAATIAAICAHLDGLPLAIELAAARVRLFSPSAMLDRLQGRLAWLTGGPRDQASRQQTLRATLDWSYNLLDPAQREVFARLAVFADGCTLEAAAAVTGAGFDPIASLVDKSLLQERAGRDGAARFSMLETIREYGLEKLLESGQDSRVRTQHAAYFAELATRAEAMLPTPGRGPWISRLDAETENMRAALAWCLHAQGDRATGLRLTGTLLWYWRRSNAAEGRRWLEEAVAEIGAAGADGRAPDLQWWGWCKAGAAFMAWLHSGREAAIAGVAEGIDLLRRSPDRLKLAHALGWLAIGESSAQRYAAAREALDEALAIFEELGQDWDQAMGLQYSGIAESEAWISGGSPAIAIHHLEESYQIFLALGDDWARSATISSLAWLKAESRNYAYALALSEEGLQLARQTGSLQVMAEALYYKAANMQIHGADYAAAVPVLEEALAAWRQLGNRRREADTLHLLGFCRMALGDLEPARTLCEESLTLFRRLGDGVQYWWAMRDLACVNRLIGEPARALELYESALRKLKGADPRWFHLVCLRDFAALLQPSREPELAARLLGAADALEESLPNYWTSSEEMDFDRRVKAEAVESARTALGAEAFACAWSAGREIPAEQAIELAIITAHTQLAAVAQPRGGGIS
jgi:predicted ATPase/transcriptional regulator with XRE-family HTH domain